MKEGILSPEGHFYENVNGSGAEKLNWERGWLVIREDSMLPTKLSEGQLSWLMRNLERLNMGQQDSLSRILLYYM